MVGGGGGCSCMLLLHPVPTSADAVPTFAPYILTFGPCACGVSLLSTGANIPLAQVVVVTSCNLRLWCFFIQPLAQILHLHPGYLHCVVVVSGGFKDKKFLSCPFAISEVFGHNGLIQKSLIRAGLIGIWTKLIGVPTIELPAVILLRFSMITTISS